jgi:hypothetical protein
MSNPMPSPPTPLALVVCDNVYQESGGKRALIGLFNQIHAEQFPAHHHRISVFVSIAALGPDMVCKLDVADAETGAVISSMTGPLPDDNPTAVSDLVFEFHDIVFPTPGTYHVRFWGNEQILVQRPIEIRAIDHDQGASTQ